jgi:peptide chain release factor 2
MSQEGFWDNQDNSTKVVKQIKVLKNIVQPWDELYFRATETKELLELSEGEEQSFIRQIEATLDSIIEETNRLEFHTLLSGEFDKNNCILSINSGAGGTESCDWVEMLFRMYSRFAQSKEFTFKVLDILLGEEAGIKNVTVLVEGPYAYGYLKAERGVHRLVRISPFDANKRRHTSFASVDAIPEVEEVDFKIEEKDLRIDVFRSSGAGGQSVNTTDSAVRITHIPTGLAAQCQNERSQHQNKQVALNILKARIYQQKQQEQEAALTKTCGTPKKKIEWGSQIRSYVLHPYNMVKDHRSDYETADTAAVLDGKIWGFIEAFLKLQAQGAN